ncbi:MAG: DUF5597 domain-containing protein [Bryobacteraceae bacterium]
MNPRSLFYLTLVCALAVVASQCNSRSVSTTQIPHLQKQGTATQLIVDGKPFLALAAELSNNGATNVDYMKPAWPKIVAAKINTVLAGVSWSQIEPQEGKFDFSVPDGIIRDARSHNLHLVLLWFATWKNGQSSYPPGWVKRDSDRFPRVQIVGGTWPVFGGGAGQPRAPLTGSIELLSPLSDANRDADAHAFAALMRHIKEVDGRQHTVIMIQVENEVGIQGDTRDRSPAANQAFEGPVPKELMDYLQQHKDTLIPELRKVWEAAGFKTSGTWQELFGKDRPTDEIFMAWYFARYVGRVIDAGKAEYPIPMYTNCPQSGFGTAPAPVRGGQSGGPMPDAMDIWRAGAPRLDLLGVDVYGFDFVMMCARFTQSGNPLFIPETVFGMEAAARVLYAFGRHDAIGFSTMNGGIDRRATPDNYLIDSYDLVTQLAPLIVEHQGKGTMSAVLLEPKDPPQKIQLGNYTLQVAFMRPRAARRGDPPPEPPTLAGAMFISTGPDEYYVAGFGVSVGFSPNTPGPPLAGLDTVEAGTFVNGRWVPGRRLAGDDTSQGDCLELRWPLGGVVAGSQSRPPGESIQRVTLYRYH